MNKHPEDPASRNPTLDDSMKLAIRDEVEKRVEQRESLYWKFGGLFAVIVVLFFGILWKVSVSEIREIVEKQLAEKEVVKARDRIMVINSAAEDMNRNIIAIASSMNTNQQSFIDRLNQIKQQDNVVLVDDIHKLFIIQRVTNLVDGRKILLDYEPIPETVEFSPTSNTVQNLNPLQRFGTVDGAIIELNPNGLQRFQNPMHNGGMSIHYVRKSLR